ncbi:MAG: SCO family protein [Elusimicrobia bacterium]|nr:SCO family protein [Elusimicrobiota bacterium]
MLFVISGCQRAPAQARALPDFALTGVTVDGVSPLDRRALRGRAWIADFVYTRCSGPCPLLTAHMASLQKRVPKSVGLLSFTVDPDHDSPEVLTLYAKRFKADPQRWFFVTGDKPELVKLFRDGFQIAVAEDPDAPAGQTVAHTTKFVLIDGEGLIRGYYDGDELESLDKLAKDAGGL